MKKRILAFITLIAMVMFAGCKSSKQEVQTPSVPQVDLTSTAEENSFTVTPPFFKVENADNGAVVYMLGSMHVGKPGAVYTQELQSALDECDTLAVEVDIQALESDLRKSAEAIGVLMCPAGTTVRDYMGADYDKIIKKFQEKGLYNIAYESYIPALWSSLWSSAAAEECGYKSELGTDMLLLTYAKQHDKKIDEIETAKEQYQVEANCSNELQMAMLNETLDLTQDEMQEQFDELYNAWKDGDTNALYELVNSESDEGLAEELQDDYEEYYNDMYANRQKKMANYVINKLKTGGKTFMVVGALHYVAEPSIIDVLEDNGYTVTGL